MIAAPRVFQPFIGLSLGLGLSLTLSLTLSLPGLGQDSDLADLPTFAHAMRVETRTIDGSPVVFQYGEVRPDFSALQGNQNRRRQALNKGWEFCFAGETKIRKIDLPHNWDSLPGANFWDMDQTGIRNPARFSGAGWYRHQFVHEKKEDRHYRFEFRGVRERVRIWVNDTEVASHAGTGQAFSLNVTPHLVDGSNEIKLKVLRLPAHRQTEEGEWEEISGVHTIHSKAPDYWPYAGVTGEVVLWEENPVTIRKVQVRNQSDKLQVQIIISNHSQERFAGKMQLESEALATKLQMREVTLPPGAVQVITLLEPLANDAAHWSPANPALHNLSAALLVADEPVDTCSLRFGLRQFTVEGHTLLLNGEPVFIKGASAYNETAKGLATHPQEHRAILERAKEADANFVRLAVRQRPPEVYQLADEIGLMVTGEWGGFWYQPEAMAAQTADAQSIYQSMAQCSVWDLTNHPSVVLWCICNECDQFCSEYEPFLKMARSRVREIDGGLLPITWAGWHPHLGNPHYEHADIIGFNEYRGSLDSFDDLKPDMDIVTERYPDKPIIIMENGSWSTRGLRGSSSKRGTEDWQADLITRQWDVLKNYRPQLSGYVHWLLQDYRSQLSYAATKRKGGWSRMGLYSEHGDAKLARDVFRDIEMK